MNASSMRWLAAVVLSLMAAVAWPHQARTQTVIEITNLVANDLRHRYFTADSDTEVRIEAMGAADESAENPFAYAWIIDAGSREPVWSMDEEITEPVDGSSWLRRYDDRLRLRRGSYELYYYAGVTPGFSTDVRIEGLAGALRQLGRWLEKGRGSGPLNDAARSDLVSKYFVRVSGDAHALRDVTVPARRGASVSILHPGGNAYIQAGFTLATDLDLEVYALGEYPGFADEFVDGGWIANAQTRQRVWEMNRNNTDHAGGAAKNRVFRGRIRLPKGSYVACYVTDDSHSDAGWNAPPPYDPDAWGLQIFPVNTADRAKIIPYDLARRGAALLRMTGVGDNELRSESFRLLRPTTLRIYAIGEYDRYRDRMVDYAWVMGPGNAKVWAMTFANTEPAGGAGKNRQFDGLVEFDKGGYVIYYTSDGSHSYGGGWNAAPPHDQESYGVTLFAPDSTFDRSSFVLSRETAARGPDVLVSIVAVGNDRDVEKQFTLPSPTRVRVHAVGEGTRAGMADYGWIEDLSSGDVVWEMTYRKTTHAGGAEKNRIVDQVILLDKGEYTVHYVTDDSHAFGTWNSAPPDDAAGWGITVTRIEAKPQN